MKTKIINRRGEVVDHDDSVIIPDGCGIRVPIMLQDAAPDATSHRLTDALGREAGHRPGHVYASNANEAAARAAYDAQVEQLGGAWRGTDIAQASPAPPDQTPAAPDAARAAYLTRLSNAWRTSTPTPGGTSA